MKLHIAYIAGFLDADGTITGSMVITNKRSLNRSFLSNVQFSNQNLLVLRDIQETLECGTIRAYTSGYSGAFRFEVPRKHQPRVLALLIPYLRIKKEQAELVLQALQLKGKSHHYIVPKDVSALRVEIIERVHFLNKRDGKAYRKNWVNSVNRSSLVTRDEQIPSQAAAAKDSVEGVTTSRVSANNNPDHECPARKGRDSLTSTVM